MDDPISAQEFAWQPDEPRKARSNLAQFLRQHALPDFAGLMARSTADPAWFTQAVLQFLDIRFTQPYTRVLDISGGVEFPRWCVDGRMNIVSNCLDKYIGTPRQHQAAMIYESETGARQTLTYHELWQRVNRAAGGLRALGIQKGEVVALYMPMTPDIIIALLAVAKIGAIILPLFSGFGAGALATRMNDTGAVAIITQDAALRRGRWIAIKPVADEAAAVTPTLRHVITARRANLSAPASTALDVDWDALLSAPNPDSSTCDTLAEDALMVIYTSGTTGQPKGALHTHCSFPVKAAQDMALCMDVHPAERVYWVTDMGWMMGPWLVFGALLLGATFVISDGAPDYPAPDRLWALVERNQINLLGVSPSLIRALMAHGETPVRQHDLSSLHAFASTGEPWNVKPWRWLFDVPGSGTLPIYNYSGGTEISGGILCGNPLTPLKPMAFSAPCPGMAAAVFDEHGQPVNGRVGELVITAPWIGMTRGFWNDPQRYLDTFWSRWPGVWRHGDWAQVDADGQWYIFGRSDDTLKIAGKRLGPAEVETVAVAHAGVLEAAAIGVPDEKKGESLVVLCVLRPAVTATPALAGEIRAALAHAFGKALSPREIHFVPDLPRTRNAKVMRRMIRAAYLGQDAGDTSALVNPESLDAIRVLNKLAG